MKTRFLITVLAFVFVHVTLFAQGQTYTFKVLVSKGTTEIKSGGTWTSLKVGSSLKATDEVKLSENSYLGLIHANGKPLEVKEAGSYTVTALANKMGKGTSVINKYTDFILSSNEEKKNRLSATGAVHRGPQVEITVFLPSAPQEKVYSDKIFLNWKPLENSTDYIVIVRNLFEEELARFETSNPFYELDLNQKALANSREFLIKVISKTDPTNDSEEFALTRLRGKERDAIKKEMSEISSTLEDETALNKFILAGFFEEKLLLVDALTAYQEAIRLEPEITAYQTAYDEFLTRIGINSK